MARLIDAGAIENHLWNIHRFYGELPCVESDKLRQEIIRKCIGEIQKAPTVDVAPAVHGVWVNMKTGCMCSVCKRVSVISSYNFDFKINYCPNCGAKMDRGGEK